MKTTSAGVAPRRRQPSKGQGALHRGITRKLRNQGGATVFSIPPHFLMEMGIQAGGDIEVSLVDGKLVAEPKIRPIPRRRRYTLAELLEGSEHLPELYAGTRGALDGASVGREMG